MEKITFASRTVLINGDMRNTSIKFNQAQRDVLNIVSSLHNEEDILALRRVLIKFMNDRMQKELDRLWDSGDLSDAKLKAMGQEHLRTPYIE